jgi:hypothetical protein
MICSAMGVQAADHGDRAEIVTVSLWESGS